MKPLPPGTVATICWIAGFAACIVLSNWALLHIGFGSGQGHPRTIPIGFGLEAPSGVIFAGALLSIRDVLHEKIGTRGTLLVIILAAPLTVLFANPSLALASSFTFVVAEIIDLVVYRRVRKRGKLRAVAVSNVVSSFTDSFLFLSLAFGFSVAIQSMVPMTIGKLGASLITIALIALGSYVVHKLSSRAHRQSLLTDPPLTP